MTCISHNDGDDATSTPHTTYNKQSNSWYLNCMQVK